MEPHDDVERPMKKILINNFLGGIAWSLGVSFGLSVVLAILGYFISKIDLVPFIGDFVSQILNSVVIKTPSLLE